MDASFGKDADDFGAALDFPPLSRSSGLALGGSTRCPAARLPYASTSVFGLSMKAARFGADALERIGDAMPPLVRRLGIVLC